jgi:uncharacterized protein (TIGR03067 family)
MASNELVKQPGLSLMRRHIVARHLGLVLVYGLLMGSDSEDAAKKEYAQFEGVWSFALVEVEGVKQPEAPFETNKMILAKDGNFIVVQGPRITRGKWKVDPTKSPKHYDVTPARGPAQGQTILCIYEMVGDTFKICVPLRGKDRPTDFVTRPGSGLMIQVFRRERKDVAKDQIAAARQELTGTWQALSYSVDGKKASDEEMKRIKLTIDLEGKAAVLREGNVFIAGTTKVNPSQDPLTVDLAYTAGDLKGQIALGIYKIESELLTICWAAPEKARPTEFTSTPGRGHTLATYMREKPSPK